MLVHLFQSLCAEPAFGLVVNPLKRQIVLWLGDDPQVCERIADLSTFVKPEAADDPVIDSDLDKAVFKLARLILRANQNGHAIQRRAFALQTLNFFANTAGFFRSVPYADHP